MEAVRSEDRTVSAQTIFDSNPSDDRFFAEQDLRARLLRNEGRMDVDLLREALEREIVKERIRTEILAAELRRGVLTEAIERELVKDKIREEIIATVALRRELEAEVRREWGLETGRRAGLSLGAGSGGVGVSVVVGGGLGRSEIGSRPISSSVGSRPTSSLVGGEKLLFQSEVQEEESFPLQHKSEAAAMLAVMGKGQVGSRAILLAKPMDTSENKRKAAVVSGAPDIAPSSLKKQKHAERNCGLCQVSATSEQGIIDHFNGKKHKAKEAALRRKTGNASVPEKVEIPSKNENATPKNGIKQEVPAKTKKLKLSVEAKKRKFQFWCEDCKVGTHSENVMNHHVKGKRHVVKMRSREVSGTVSTTKTPSDCTDRKQDSVVDANEEDTGNSNKELVEVEGLEIKLDDDAKAVHAKEKV